MVIAMRWLAALFAFLVLAGTAQAQGHYPSPTFDVHTDIQNPIEQSCLGYMYGGYTSMIGCRSRIPTSDLVGTGAPSPTSPYALDPRAFGAHCDGVTDDTAALQSWLSTFAPFTQAVIPGLCIFTAPLVAPSVDNVALWGTGKGSALIYAGASTTINGLTIGSIVASGCSVKGWTIQGVRVMSQTQMTAGDGLLIQDMCGSEISNLAVGDNPDLLNGDTHWWNGLHFNGGNSIHMRGFFLAAKNTAEIVNGDANHDFTDLYQAQGKIVNSTIGLNIAGRAGGVTTDQTDILENGTNIRVSQDQIAQGNNQIFFGPGVAIDATSGGAGIGIDVADPGGGEAMLVFAGTWLASAVNQCLLVESGAGSANGWNILWSGGNILNCNSGAAPAMVDNQSLATGMNIFFAGTRFFQCCATSSLYAINNRTGAIPVQIQGATFNLGNDHRVQGPWNGCLFDTGTTTCNYFHIAGQNNPNGGEIQLQGNGATTPNKSLRAYNGEFDIVNNAYTQSILRAFDWGGLALPPKNYADLPGCGGSGAPTGTQAVIVDGSTNAWGAAVAGGGSNVVQVWCNGGAWTVTGR